MKNNILRISIVPVLALIMLTVNDLQQKGNDKGNKGNKEQQGSNGKGNDKDKGYGQGQDKDKGRGNDHSAGNQGNDNSQGKGNDNGRGNDKDKENRGNDKKDNDMRADNGRGNDKDDHEGNGKMKGNGKREVIRWVNHNDVNWNLVDFSNRKHPKDYKKVTVCHQTGNEFPVTINISENALQAHLNHGDTPGNCTVTYTDRWPKNYIIAREGVYNVYETTWENMSYGEALVRLALEKLTGLKSNLAQTRTTLTPVEVQRREVLIMDLENNTTALQNQLVVTRQRLDGVNIYIPL